MPPITHRKFPNGAVRSDGLCSSRGAMLVGMVRARALDYMANLTTDQQAEKLRCSIAPLWPLFNSGTWKLM